MEEEEEEERLESMENGKKEIEAAMEWWMKRGSIGLNGCATHTHTHMHIVLSFTKPLSHTHVL